MMDNLTAIFIVICFILWGVVAALLFHVYSHNNSFVKSCSEEGGYMIIGSLERHCVKLDAILYSSDDL